MAVKCSLLPEVWRSVTSSSMWVGLCSNWLSVGVVRVNEGGGFSCRGVASTAFVTDHPSVFLGDPVVSLTQEPAKTRYNNRTYYLPNRESTCAELHSHARVLRQPVPRRVRG